MRKQKLKIYSLTLLKNKKVDREELYEKLENITLSPLYMKELMYLINMT